jgi:rhodanese-related sulfurtransferase
VDVPQITVAELVPLHAAGATVIDVREPREYVEGHVPGAALIPLGSVPERVSEIPSGAPVYVICHSGARSNAAAEVLRANGIDAVNVAGGTMAWIQAGNEVVPGERPT